MAAAVFELNGQTVSVDDVDPHCTLLEWLRASGLTGSKEGCAEGECGACAVAFLGRDEQGRPRYEPVNSCLVSLPEVHGRSIVTVEGVSLPGGALHPVQEAMVRAGGSQCGYCTPGFVMSLFCEYYRPDRDGYDPEAISGNLCRCTGYRPIADVARGMGTPAANDPCLIPLGKGPRELPPLEYAARCSRGGTPHPEGRRFFRPTSTAELARILWENPGAVLLGGGTDLMVSANQRHTRHAVLVSVGAIAELCSWNVSETEITIGAALPLSQLERLVEHFPWGTELGAVRQLLRLFSSRLIRNRATLGGNLATASPIGDAAPVLLALGAELTLQTGGGQRRVPLAEFFHGYRQTALAPGEWIASVHLRRPLPRIQRFYKVSKRVLDDISTVAAAFALELGPDGSVERLGAAYGGIAATPLRAGTLERLALGKPWRSEATLQLLLDAVRGIGTPLSDQRGSAAYRGAMVEKLLERFHAETNAQLAEAAE
ncbi:MAG TPA: FAD binding domain-containing protein [Polyangiaceae bacterium]|nr:FAD binding domain-containing protein [Polyangiaceae bacterium]